MRLLPGDLGKDRLIDRIIRVNHAGEYGAKRIYMGQLSVLKGPDDQKLLKHMASQEEVHLNYFTQEIPKRRVRPSLFLPLWHMLGYATGYFTATLDKNSAMICTEAVEEVIDSHYQAQLKQLSAMEENDLIKKIEIFRQEELEHHKIAQDHMQNLTFSHKVLYHIIKFGCKMSIKLAKHC